MTATVIDVAGRDGGRVSMDPGHLEDLRTRIQGRVLRPGDEGWDGAVLIWNAIVSRTPALVVQPEAARDVAAAVGFARDHGLLISVKGGGHNIAGTALADGGLTLDMSRMRDVAVEPGVRLAHVGPGCQLSDVDRATQRHGLATVLGCTRSRSSPPTARSAPRTATGTPSSSGLCAGAGATSGSSPGSPSACTRSAR